MGTNGIGKSSWLGNMTGASKKPAISIKNAFKTYSKKPGVKPIINGLNMTVQRGHIYSLLGSSGCGKTTLLSCVTGMRRLDSGEILVFGKIPGSDESGVPGHRVGFMPQEIALNGEFSIGEMLWYFGQLFGMNKTDVVENSNFLVNFLKLPPSERRINSLSGGQQRRVSFAAALMHNPELLILDEPTVGVDPLLRQNIWSHLVKLAKGSNSTIIITTHFIEEARDSNCIGLMRNGRLLTEDTPVALMNKYNTNILEDIVVELCLRDTSSQDDEGNPTDKTEASTLQIKVATPPLALTPNLPEGDNARKSKNVGSSPSIPFSSRRISIDTEPSIAPLNVPGINRWPSLGQVLHRARIEAIEDLQKTETKKHEKTVWDKFVRIKALVHKNCIVLLRNLAFVGFLLGLPAASIFFVCTAVAKAPHNLNIGLVNNEIGFNGECSTPASEVGCIMSSLEKFNSKASCEILRHLMPDVFIITKYKSLEDAKTDLEKARLWGLMTFPENFTQHLKDRIQFGTYAGPETLKKSTIDLKLDMSSYVVRMVIMKSILEGFQVFLKETAKACNADPEGTELPIHFSEPVFGNENTSIIEYIAPGTIIALLFFFPSASTAMAMVMEQCSGALERSMVAGVTSFEIMISHFVTQFTLLIIQTIISFVVVLILYDIEVIGSTSLAFILGVSGGITGISFGFTVSSISRNELEALLLTISAFTPILVLSGLFWPVEGMESYSRIVSNFVPVTHCSAALRSIISRGFGFFHRQVFTGFLTVLGWSIFFCLIALLIFRRKNKR